MGCNIRSQGEVKPPNETERKQDSGVGGKPQKCTVWEAEWMCIKEERLITSQILLSKLATGFSYLEAIWIPCENSFWLNSTSKSLVGVCLREDGRRGIKQLFEGYKEVICSV